MAVRFDGYDRAVGRIDLSEGTNAHTILSLLAALVTTTEREPAVPLAGEYVEGDLPFDSFVNPWNVLTLKHDAITKRVAHASEAVVRDTAEELQVYLKPESSR